MHGSACASLMATQLSLMWASRGAVWLVVVGVDAEVGVPAPRGGPEQRGLQFRKQKEGRLPRLNTAIQAIIALNGGRGRNEISGGIYMCL